MLSIRLSKEKAMENKPKLATRDDKIRGCISLALTIACLSFAYWQADQKFAVPGLVAGMLYFMTTLAIMFKDVDSFDN